MTKKGQASMTPVPTPLHVTCPTCKRPIPFVPADILSTPTHSLLSHPRRQPGSKTDRRRQYGCNALVEVTKAAAGFRVRAL